MTDNKNGSYRYVFATSLSNVKTPVGKKAISYERNRLHRVTLMMGGLNGPTATAYFDFVPNGSTVKESRSIVETKSCKACHGVEFRGHDGDRLIVENCVTCHVPGAKDAQGGEDLDFKVMIHKIHAGSELASIPRPDGKVFDDPATPVNEAADNGRYAIWGSRNTKREWWKAGFPAIIENCTKCHQGAGVNVDNWKNVPSRAACGSCHDHQPANPTGNEWSGALPIAKRVHAVHFGAKLNYPLTTVGYANGDPVKGRHWDITFPQDVRNCETCHPAATTSGTWKTKPGRLPCSGCHDSDAAKAHMKLQTWDTTLANAWNGDEVESCKTCH